MGAWARQITLCTFTTLLSSGCAAAWVTGRVSPEHFAKSDADCFRYSRLPTLTALAFMLPSKEELIATVQRHYDSTNGFLFTTELSPEVNRRSDIWDQWIANMSSWHALRDELESALPDYRIGETYCSADGGPRCIVYTPKGSKTSQSSWDVVGCVSLLAPVYFVHGVEWVANDGRRRNTRASFELPPPHMAEPARAVAHAIEKMLGLGAFPREWVETPVPLYAGLLEPPRTNLLHALFTNAPASIP